MSQLANFINAKQPLTSQPLAMTHVIYGYPSIEASLEWMQTLLEMGVETLEVQFPFSDPVADGPSIVQACHKALESEPKMQQCLADLGRLGRGYPNSKILLMSYLNPVYRFGISKLVKEAAEQSLTGLILPDLPIEHAAEYQDACVEHNLDAIWLITPNMPKERIKQIATQATGMLYCVSRSGVTGQKSSLQTEFDLAAYLAEIRQHTDVPLAVGFGIRSPQQVAELTGLADIAIVGSALLDAHNQGGIATGKALVANLFPQLA